MNATYTKMNKAQARKLYDNGQEFIAIPHKLNPDNQYWGMGAVINNRIVPDFEKACNALEYYSCNNETGYYLAFYTVS